MSKLPIENKFLNSITAERNGSVKQVIKDAACQNVRPYSSNQEYLYAMREDLADWLKGLYAIDISAENFFTSLETGTLLCQHANNITTCAEYVRKNNIKVESKYITKFPTKFLLFNQGKYVRATSFFARDNIASFIGWCRNELRIPESVMFETNDLVLRYNEKNVILCLLEVARRGSKFGVPAPVLVQIEEDIEKEIEFEKRAKESDKPPPEPVQQKVTCDFKSLDEMVQHILGMCTCPSQFPMVRVGDGKYKVGDSENLIFMRILRQHVMVRVGGGWDTLEHYLNKHDPCRCFKHKSEKALTPRQSRIRNSQVRPSLQQQSSLPSSASPPKAANKPSNRFSKSTSNLSELSLTSRSEKAVNRRSTVLRSTNSSTSETSSSDIKSPTSRLSRSLELNQRKTNSTSTNRKEKLSLPKEDVFTRLSRPKSTPPSSRYSLPQQKPDDHLTVQRNKKGTHQVQRSTISEPPSQLRTKTNKAKTSPDKNESKSKSVFSMSSTFLRKKDPSSTPSSRKPRPSSVSITSTPRSRPARTTISSVSSTSFMRNNRPKSGSKTPRPKSTIGIIPSNPEKPSQVRPSTPKTTRPTEVSVFEVGDDKERQMLKAFEKECISNQYSLQRDQVLTRKSSSDSLSERRRRFSSRSSAEDSEVAMHMQNMNERDDKTRPSHPPTSYHSLPRPRKDKVDISEHPTRIPTPISFSRPLLNGKLSEPLEKTNDEVPKRSQVRPQTPEKVDKGDEKTVRSSTPLQKTSAPYLEDIRRPRISLEEINRLLNSKRSSVENKFKPRTKSAILTTIPNGDSTSLRSSGHRIEDKNDNSSTFAPVSIRINGNETPEHHTSQPRSPPSAFPNYFNHSNRFSSSDVDLNHNVKSYHDNHVNKNSIHEKFNGGFVPNHESYTEPRAKKNGLQASFASKAASLDEQWV